MKDLQNQQTKAMILPALRSVLGNPVTRADFIPPYLMSIAFCMQTPNMLLSTRWWEKYTFHACSAINCKRYKKFKALWPRWKSHSMLYVYSIHTNPFCLLSLSLELHFSGMSSARCWVCTSAYTKQESSLLWPKTQWVKLCGRGKTFKLVLIIASIRVSYGYYLIKSAVWMVSLYQG